MHDNSCALIAAPAAPRTIRQRRSIVFVVRLAAGPKRQQVVRYMALLRARLQVSQPKQRGERGWHARHMKCWPKGALSPTKPGLVRRSGVCVDLIGLRQRCGRVRLHYVIMCIEWHATPRRPRNPSRRNRRKLARCNRGSGSCTEK